jgi:hypothetical protein
MAKVASGGETARLMLALKSTLAHADATPTLIFDEIDQGIGGRVGGTVGRDLVLGQPRPVEVPEQVVLGADGRVDVLQVEAGTHGWGSCGSRGWAVPVRTSVRAGCAQSLPSL